MSISLSTYTSIDPNEAADFSAHPVRHHGFAHWLGRHIAAACAWNAKRMAPVEMPAMSDQLLADIGLRHSDTDHMRDDHRDWRLWLRC